MEVGEIIAMPPTVDVVGNVIMVGAIPHVNNFKLLVRVCKEEIFMNFLKK